MKHSLKIVILLLVMFFITQLIGIAVINLYSPQTKQITTENGTINITSYNLPYGTEPPQGLRPQTNFISIIISITIAVIIMLFLMRFKAELFLRGWFFLVVTLAIAITLNSVLKNFPILDQHSLIALLIALPLGFLKVFKRNIIVHNLTELIIYPGIAAIFVPLLNVLTIVLLLIIISAYDIYAVWHAGFMQKMAKYQIKKVRVFSGFFVPYLGSKERKLLQQVKQAKRKEKSRKIKVSVAILGGGDIVFPMILAGIVLYTFNFFSALIIALGATISLAFLFYISKKGKFYPAMPFITAGCFIALSVVYLLN